MQSPVYLPESDIVKVLEDLVQPEPGAPCPLFVASEHRLLLAYFARDGDPNWDDAKANPVKEGAVDEPIAIITFVAPYAHTFGPPNDEAFAGHPLHARGLRPWRVQEVLASSWINSLARMNSVHPYHKQEQFDRLRHFVFAFHDTTFECAAEGVEVAPYRGSQRGAFERMSRMIGDELV